jgi:PPK2 family polyphosphate:nucleotide phosphotransferase
VADSRDPSNPSGRREHGADFRQRYRVPPEGGLSLANLDPSDTAGVAKEEAGHQLDDALARLTDLQDRFWAEAKRALLVVLQGIDTAGKDGTIRRVVGAFNPQGVSVSTFKVPTPFELAHDYLWRVHQRTPGKGEIGVFNRSHYEDVLVVRVHRLAPESVWSRRYDHINAWERMLTDEGTTVVKFLLIIDRDEQRRRLQARLDDPTKRWKFSLGDLDERARWDDYTAAFDACLARTSTEWAPWYLIPANHKWFRDLAVAEILSDVLEELHPHYPQPKEDLSQVVVP